MPDARRLARIAGQQESYFLFCAVEETLCPNGVCLCRQVDDEFNRFAAASAAGLQAEAEVFFSSKLLLMPLAISIAFAIIHYRKGRLNLQPPRGLS